MQTSDCIPVLGNGTSAEAGRRQLGSGLLSVPPPHPQPRPGLPPILDAELGGRVMGLRSGALRLAAAAACAEVRRCPASRAPARLGVF